MRHLFSRRSSRSTVAPPSGRRRRLLLEPLEDRRLLAGLPYGASVNDTAEYMLGKVLVTPVFVESREGSGSDLYDWTATHINEVKEKIQRGMTWWEDTLAAITDKHSLEFVFDWTYADNPVDTEYEAITRKSTEYSNWVPQALTTMGVPTTGDLGADVRAFNNSQRMAQDTDWAFTMFVVNAEQDPDDRFAACTGGQGCFPQAFAFAGGLFLISPSTRPDSTFTHETGHIFWAYDEYPNSASYNDRRGYYDAQNTNAVDDNPNANFIQEPSIMSTGGSLTAAFNTHTSAASTLALIGWQDSDGDGVFDVLDVPHTLSGTGWIDSPSGMYRFVGSSSVQTLPNQNSSGLKNDITINKISRAEYRVDGGAWQTAGFYDEYQADLDLTFPVPIGDHSIEIRTIDDTSGVTSPVFVGSTSGMSTTTEPGLNGFAWNDVDGDGQHESGEVGLSGWTVQLVDIGGQPITMGGGVEPDDHPNQTGSAGDTLNTVNSAVTLSAIGSSVGRADVIARTSAQASTGTQAFFNYSSSSGSWSNGWSGTRQLRMDFTTPVSRVAIDAVGDGSGDTGRLEIYNAAGDLLARYTSDQLARDAVETMELSRVEGDIAYAIAFGHMGTSVVLDNLRFGAQASTTTGEYGEYSLPLLPAGSYRVNIVSPTGWSVTTASGPTIATTLASGATVTGLDFGLRQSDATWQNPANRYDTNNDGFVSPIDALLIINVLNAEGAHPLEAGVTPAMPYIDVNADSFVSPIDALHVINELNRAVGSGEHAAAGESTSIADERRVVRRGSECRFEDRAGSDAAEFSVGCQRRGDVGQSVLGRGSQSVGDVGERRRAANSTGTKLATFGDPSRRTASGTRGGSGRVAFPPHGFG
ncbi:MAG: dockerin type I domain-containing protein [Pirellulaceae bacterium]